MVDTKKLLKNICNNPFCETPFLTTKKNQKFCSKCANRETYTLTNKESLKRFNSNFNHFKIVNSSGRYYYKINIPKLIKFGTQQNLKDLNQIQNYIKSVIEELNDEVLNITKLKK